MATVTPTPNIQPMKRPKYLLLSAISNHTPQTQNHSSSRHIDSPRGNIWRSETVMYLFVDAWLRFDFDETRDLPSNEFIRLVRVLIKQLHAFGNAAEQDNTTLQMLRQMSQPLMNNKMYGLLKSLISRWPLDSSFSDVLELWLSYIQPWRYVHNRDLNTIADMPIPSRYETFISENLIAFTQIYVKLMPRFERIDLSSLKNVFMLFRMLKVFGQSNLSDILKRYETSMQINSVNGMFMDPSSISPVHLKERSPNRTGVNASEFRSYGHSETLEEPYVPLFSGDFVFKIEQLTRKILVMKNIAKNNLKEIEVEYEKKHKGVAGFLKSLFSSDEDSVLTMTISDRKKVPELLDYCAQTMNTVFDVHVPEPNFTTEVMEDDEIDGIRSSIHNTSERNMSEFSDASFSVSPSFVRPCYNNIYKQAHL